MAKQKTSHTKYKVNVGDRVMSVLIYVIYAIFAFVCVYPFYYIFINSISNNDISARGKVLFLPKEIHFTNYARVGQISFDRQNSDWNGTHCRDRRLSGIYVHTGYAVEEKALVPACGGYYVFQRRHHSVVYHDEESASDK